MPDITFHGNRLTYSIPIRVGREGGNLRCVIQCDGDGTVSVCIRGLEETEQATGHLPR
jgi:hypothetical protein